MMNVKVEGFKGAERCYLATHRNTENAITAAQDRLMGILRNASGEYTESSELEALGVDRVVITFEKV